MEITTLAFKTVITYIVAWVVLESVVLVYIKFITLLLPYNMGTCLYLLNIIYLLNDLHCYLYKIHCKFITIIFWYLTQHFIWFLNHLQTTGDRLHITYCSRLRAENVNNTRKKCQWKNFKKYIKEDITWILLHITLKIK